MRSRVLIMGVAGCGKTTIGRLLVERLSAPAAGPRGPGVPRVWRCIDADDFHPQANVAKMARGEPLTDADRAGWLDAIAADVRHGFGDVDGRDGVVVACSALRADYRERLIRAAAGPGGENAGSLWLIVWLVIGQVSAESRVGSRRHHFMPRGLVADQFRVLEPVRGSEHAIASGGRLLKLNAEHATGRLVEAISVCLAND